MLAEKIASPVYYLMLAVLVLNLLQRKEMKTGEKKRFATLYLAGVLLLFQLEIGLLVHFKQADWMLVPAIGIIGLIIYLLRSKLFIFRRTCTACGEKLEWKALIGRDDNLCKRCAAPEGDITDEKVNIAPPTIDESQRHQLGKGSVLDEIPRDVAQIDWDSWEFAEKAVLCYLFDGDQVLLIKKKTGLGRGKINAPGGRIEEAEMPEEAARREFEEETGLRPKELRQVALLHFVFTDGYSLKGTVYFAKGYEGALQATEEADPFWTATEEMPYDQMWEDDIHWLPKALAGSRINARFIFDDEKIISKEIEEQTG